MSGDDPGDGLAGGDMQRARVERSRMRAATMFAVVVSALIAADDAHACLCRIFVGEPICCDTVPRNVRVIPPFANDTDGFVLLDALGAEVAIDVTETPWLRSLHSVVPQDLLEAGQTFTLYSAGALVPILDFSTHDGVDETPPSVPTVVEVEARSIAVLGSTCGSDPANGATFVLENLDDVSIALVGRDPEETAGDNVFEGRDVVAFSQDWPVVVGNGPCLSGWPERRPQIGGGSTSAARRGGGQ